MLGLILKKVVVGWGEGERVGWKWLGVPRAGKGL